MLVLSRRVGDSITIGDDVVVTILEVRSDVVRVGIDAPRSVRVHRSELLAQLESSNRQAASPSADAVSSLREQLQQRRPGDSADDGADDGADGGSDDGPDDETDGPGSPA